MYSSWTLPVFLISTSLVSNAFSQSTDDPTRRAEAALSSLQIWYDAGTGLWQTTGWWNSANAMTTIANLALNDRSAQVQGLASHVFANTLTQAPAHNPQPGIEGHPLSKRDGIIDDIMELFNATDMVTGYDKMRMGDVGEPMSVYPEGWNKVASYVDVSSLPIFKTDLKVDVASANANDWLDGFYDDDLWWALAWIAAYDVTKDRQYLTLADSIFKSIATTWGTNCGNGGIWWSWKQDYANAIANELFLSTAAHLANRMDDKEYYIKWARAELEWFIKSGMINDKNLINDGLTKDCNNNGQTTWSYNQGVILGALVELNKASADASYLALASRIAHAAVDQLTDDDGILHDACEPNCGADGGQFKGIFARNLAILHAEAPDDAFGNFIWKNADSVWENDRDEANMFSVNWAGPFIPSANASTHSSAMDVLVGAIVVG